MPIYRSIIFHDTNIDIEVGYPYKIQYIYIYFTYCSVQIQEGISLVMLCFQKNINMYFQNYWALLAYHIITAVSRYVAYPEKLYHCSTNYGRF